MPHDNQPRPIAASRIKGLCLCCKKCGAEIMLPVTARERYAHLVLPTLQTPTEIWRSQYGDEDRERFLKFWRDGDKAMLVVISLQKGDVLWNVVPMPLRSVDRQREGVLLWKEYQ